MVLTIATVDSSHASAPPHPLPTPTGSFFSVRGNGEHRSTVHFTLLGFFFPDWEGCLCGGAESTNTVGDMLVQSGLL